LRLRKIIKFARYQILSLKCTKFDFGWASPDPTGEAYNATPDSLTRFKGATSKGGDGMEGERAEERSTGVEGTIFKSAPLIFWFVLQLRTVYCKLIVWKLQKLQTAFTVSQKKT